MAYDQPHIKVTANGVLTSTEEIFSFGFKLSVGGAQWSNTIWDAVKANPNDIISAVTAFFQDPDGYVPETWALQTVKLALIGTDGKYVGAPIEEVFNPTLPGGANATLYGYAPQLSTVITLISGKFRDPGRYNRFYVPSVAIATASGKMDPIRQVAIATRAQEFINNVNEACRDINPTLQVSVVSQGNATTPPLSTYVQELSVGQVLDTQRRRRNKLTENYVVVPIT